MTIKAAKVEREHGSASEILSQVIFDATRERPKKADKKSTVPPVEKEEIAPYLAKWLLGNEVEQVQPGVIEHNELRHQFLVTDQDYHIHWILNSRDQLMMSTENDRPTHFRDMIGKSKVKLERVFKWRTVFEKLLANFNVVAVKMGNEIDMQAHVANFENKIGVNGFYANRLPEVVEKYQELREGGKNPAAIEDFLVKSLVVKSFKGSYDPVNWHVGAAYYQMVTGKPTDEVMDLFDYKQAETKAKIESLIAVNTTNTLEPWYGKNARLVGALVVSHYVSQRKQELNEIFNSEMVDKEKEVMERIMEELIVMMVLRFTPEEGGGQLIQKMQRKELRTLVSIITSKYQGKEPEEGTED